MPLAAMCLDGWPRFLRPLVAEHGAAAVWSVGLDVVGFPPTWIDLYGEARPLLARFETHRP